MSPASLYALRKGRSARVTGLAPAALPGDEDLRLRLLELGFVPGEEVRIIAEGFPGRDPLAVRVGSSTFALRRHEAELVLVDGSGAVQSGTAQAA